MKTSGVLINYFIHCKRECWLFANDISYNDNSELVKIGKFFHEEKFGKDKFERGWEEFKADNIEGDYVVEFKKSSSDEKAAEYQLLFYLYKLKQKGIVKKGLLKFKERKNLKPGELQSKEVILTSEKEIELEEIIKKIEELVRNPEMPLPEKKRKCLKCAYYQFCFV